ncbi:MAG: NUDIX domain-containing protein, partial [Streptosporangiaceae bacterium]
EQEQWYAGLPSMTGATAALITAPSGWPLLVKPNYRDNWSLPGGILEHGEAPHVGCAREVAEEIGLTITPAGLLAVAWLPPDGIRPRSFVFFMFDGGEVAADVEIKLQAEELDDYRFVDPGELAAYLPPFIEARVRGALEARETGATLYLPNGVLWPALP